MDVLDKEPQTKETTFTNRSSAGSAGSIFAILGLSVVFFIGVLGYFSFMVGNALHTNALHLNVQNASIAYDSWTQDHTNATEDEKNNAVKNFTKSLEAKGNIGVAFDSATNKICAWENGALSNKDINHSLTASSINGVRTIGRGVDCSMATTIISPTTAMNKSNEKPQGNDNSSEFPWLGVLSTSGIVLAGTGGIIFGMKKSLMKRKKRTNDQVKLKKLLDRHEAVRQAWASYELDPMKMLEYPLLSDMRENTTRNLLFALRKANDIRENHSMQALQVPEVLTDYRNAVLELEHAFEIAEQEAKRVQWNKFSADEQKRLMTAKNLLNFVLDANGSEFERQAAYKRLAKEINGLVVLPDLTLKSLENTMRKMLTD